MAIASGTVRAGSLPGSAGRDPALEADAVPVELPAFAIDRRPFPNREGLPPRAGATLSEAEALCRHEGKRLCTELEWERACEGDDDREYPSGATFDRDLCLAEPASCATSFGVLALGIEHAEWTASGVVRGSASANASAHRCAARAPLAPSSRSSAVAFRCCTGEAHGTPYPTEPERPGFREIAVPLAEQRAALESTPELARFAASFEPFTEGDVSAVFSRGGVEPVLAEGVRRAHEVIEWSPRAGELAWIVTGRSGRDSLIAVLYPLAGGGFRHAASMILEGDPLSVLVTYAAGNRSALSWTT
ncbi:MAG: SUMF1/EgtB/PvdO family nonheme iron enzyme, partial [Polyangiaceae bacterium]|nr:SUMF1/EgtB/PvdO family nonheme iron enzyme [Polyangiaceae bacterium]